MQVDTSVEKGIESIVSGVRDVSPELFSWSNEYPF